MAHGTGKFAYTESTRAEIDRVAGRQWCCRAEDLMEVPLLPEEHGENLKVLSG